MLYSASEGDEFMVWGTDEELNSNLALLFNDREYFSRQLKIP